MTDEDDEDEREALRSENLGLRGEVKRLEKLLATRRYRENSPHASVPRASALALRSSMRSSDTEGKAEPKRITFSRPDTHSSKRTSVVSSERPSLNQRTGSDRLSVTFGDLPKNSDLPKRVSLEGLSPTRKSISLHTAALVLNAVRTFKASIRKTRAKQSLFKVARDANQPWSLKFAAADTYSPDAPSVGFITGVMGGIDVCRSVTRNNPDLLRAIATGVIGIQVSLGDTVCRQGEPGLYFMVVDGGEFVAESLGQPSRDLRKGDTFGEAVFIHPSPLSSMSVTCTSPAGGSLWVIHSDALRQVLKQSSMKLLQLARETLDSSPKILRDSINAVQMAAACKAAEFTYVSAGEPFLASSGGLVLSVSGTVTMGSVVVPASQIVVEKDSVFLTISQREIDSIPPLSVSLSAIMRNAISGDSTPPVLTIESVATPSSFKPTLPRLTAPRMSLDSGSHELATTGHPLSPSLRPNLTEIDVSKILFFNLLSISARTHLVNKVQLITIPYNSADGPVPLDLGIILVLNGTALVKSATSSITLDLGHCIGFGEISSGELRGPVVVEAVSDFLDLDEVVASPPPPVVLAHWSREVILGALPSELQSQPNEESVISYLKKRKLLIRNPIFQFLPEASLHAVIAASSTVPLDHKDTLSAMVGPDQSFVVTDGSVVTIAPDIEGQTFTFGDFFVLNGSLLNIPIMSMTRSLLTNPRRRSSNYRFLQNP